MKHRTLLSSTLALVMIAAMLLSPAPPTAQAAPDAPDAAFSYTNSVSYNIPDGTSTTNNGCNYWPATRYFLVNDFFTVNDLNVEFSQSHATRGQIRMRLTAPDGTTKILMATSTIDAFDNYYITIDDASTLPLNDGGNDTIGGTRRTVGPSTNGDLDAFNGKDAHGHWTMTICDNVNAWDGTGTPPTQPFNEARLVFDGTAYTPTPYQHKQGPSVVETYFVPWPEDQVWTAMGRIFPTTCSTYNGFRDGYDAAPRQPMVGYISLVVGEANTVITYDHWEDGYEASISFPSQAKTQVWGDGDLLNGAAPGDADDVLAAGQVLTLNNVMLSTTLGAVFDFDARDKIAASAPIAVTRSVWSDGSQTLFAAADEAYPTDRWGTQFYAPVGDNANYNGMFEYSVASIIAATDGTLVDIDKDGNGVYETTGIPLNQGGTYFIDDTGTGLSRGGRIRSNAGHPIQVNQMTADVCAGYESRTFPLKPFDQWDSSYYVPVGTTTTNPGAPSNDDAPTTVSLYNPGASSITVSYQFATGAASSVTVAANGGANVTMNNGTGARFWTANGALFYAIASVDSDNAGGTGSDRNDTYDWGITLVPEKVLSQYLIVGWAPGDDPTFQGAGAENTAPIWLTGGHPAGSANPTATYDICVDYNGDCTPGTCTQDPVTLRYYDRKVTNIAPRAQLKIYKGKVVPPDTGNGTAGDDQTGTQIWVCGPTTTTPDAIGPNDTVLDSDVLITAAWGEDPLVAQPAKPGLDMGYTVRNLRAWTMAKGVSLWDDVNDNDLYDEGETVRYTIDVVNKGAGIPAGVLNVTDQLPVGVTYVANSTRLVNHLGATSTIPDGPPGPTFPLEGGGYTYGLALPAAETFQIYFDVTINTGTAGATLCNLATGTDGAVELGAEACLFVQEPVRGAIGNYVWFDEDGDGDQDAGEYGIPNVQVDLYQDTDNNGSYETLVATTYTDANGGYLFPGLLPGNYRVDVVASTLPDPDGPGGPGGLHQTYDEDDGTGPFATANSTFVNLGSGVEHLTADFGYNWAPPGDTNNPPLNALGAIGDRVWIDVDGDGVQDAGEAGIGGVPVQLYYDSNNDGVIDAIWLVDTGNGPGVAVTDAAGFYIFDQLPAGIYEVRVNSGAGVAGYTQTGDPDQFGATCTACDNKTTTPIVLGPGDVFLNADFGYQPATSFSIGNTVFFDADADGTYEPNGNDGNAGTSADNEYGIPGVTVALIRDNGDGVYNPADDPIVATTITGDDPSTPAVVETGWYGFSGLPGGTQYWVWVNDTENVLGEVEQSGEPGATDGGVACVICNDRSPAVVPVGPSTVLQDFGYTPIDHAPARGAIGDTVFLDANNDGLFQPGEGLEGVVVALYDDEGNKLAQTTTDENGHYYFGNLDPNNVTYVVQVQTSTLPNGGAGLTNHVDPDDPSPGDSFSTWTLTPTAPINLNQDFGYRPANNPGSIGNYIWEDTNADGVNNEPAANGIGGVTVDLYEDSNNNGIIDSGDHLVGQTTTAANGSYLFQNLPPGNYLVDVTDDAQVLNGYWHSLGSQTPGADNQSKQDPHKVTLTAGQNYVAADFGYYVEPAAVGNWIWYDINGDGIQNDGETGINGVEVRLTVAYPNGNTTVLTVVTANDPSGNPGWYSFGNLLQDEDYNGAGTYGLEPTYTVSVNTTQPALAALIPSPTGQGTPTTDSNDPAGSLTAPVQGQTNTLRSNDGATIASYDFGFRAADWGDLPDNYNTTAGNSGAYHTVDGSNPNLVRLGACLDSEADGQPSVPADGDDLADSPLDFGGACINDEDGVSPFGNWTNGTGQVRVTVNGAAACLNAWMDFATSTGTVQAVGDGSFNWFPGSGASEWIIQNQVLAVGSNQQVNFPLPVGLPAGTYYLRFRATPVDQNGACDPNAYFGGSPTWLGAANGGEVEDYLVDTTPLAVLLAGFDATPQPDHVLVAWETVSEASNTGFNLYRSLSADGEYALLGFTPSASPGSTAGAAYSYQDFAVLAGQTYWYRLEDVDLNGAATLHGPISVVFQAPTAVALDTLAADGGAGSLALPWLLAALLAAGAAALLVDRRRRNTA